jgi:hypothetical protein
MISYQRYLFRIRDLVLVVCDRPPVRCFQEVASSTSTIVLILLASQDRLVDEVVSAHPRYVHYLRS